MHTIDKDTFKKDESYKNTIFMDNEEVLWSAIPKKKAFILQNCIFFIPFAVLWGCIDLFFIIMIFTTMLPEVGSSVLLFAIPFFALHLLPVWICIFSIVKSYKKAKRTKYYITNHRVIETNTANDEAVVASINFCDIKKCELTQSPTDIRFKVGDIHISDNNNAKIVLFDIHDSSFILDRLKYVIKNEEKMAFYNNQVTCQYCNSTFPNDIKVCPHCGASVIINFDKK